MRPETRRDVVDVIVAWAIGLLSMAAAAILFTGCGVASPTEASDYTSVERALVDDTARWAGQLGVSVRGAITSQHYPDPNMDATGWLDGGVAYYYRPNVERWVRLVPTPGYETASNVAAHEVAHALYRAHDTQHWCCTVHMGATPTYPAPVVGLTCDVTALRCRP